MFDACALSPPDTHPSSVHCEPQCQGRTGTETSYIRHSGHLLGHNSDLRDSHEYIKKQVWGEEILTRQSSRRVGLVEKLLVLLSAIIPFYVLTPHIYISIHFCKHGCLSNLSCADHFTSIKYNNFFYHCSEFLYYIFVSFCSERKDQRKYPG